MQTEMIDCVYLATLKALKIHEEEVVFRPVFHHLTEVLRRFKVSREKVDRLIASFLERIQGCKEKILKRFRRFMYEYQNQLCCLYMMLTDGMANQASCIFRLPELLDELLAKEECKELNQSKTKAYLYIVCSHFMPIFMAILHSYDSIPIGPQNPESLTFGLDFSQLSQIYIDQKPFLDEVLTKPLRIICNIPPLKDYDFYQQISLIDVFNMGECLFSSSLIDPDMSELIETYNYAKIINFRELFSSFPNSNNSLLNAIERMKMTGILPQKVSKIQPSWIKPFSFTFIISKKHFLKLRLFFERLPPQLAPLTKYDALSYGKGDQCRLYYYHFATEEYWQHCPQSEFCSVYYLCNTSEVEWMSIPADQYCRLKKKIRLWSQEETESAVSKKNLVRGLQKMGQIVVIGSGHEYFWKVKKGNGLAVLLKWSILLKEYSQLIKFVNVVKKQQKFLEDSHNWLNFPHRRTALSFLSHELACLSPEIITFLSKFLRKSVKKEENLFSKLCVKHQHRVIIQRQILPVKYRNCGLCGRQILNMYSSVKQNTVCLQCLPQELAYEDGVSKIQLNYMWKPSQFEQYFKSINKLHENNNEDIARLIMPYEHVFCQGEYLGSINSNVCLGEADKSSVCFPNHMIHTLPNLELHIFMKRSNLCSIEAAIRLYSSKIKGTIDQQTKMNKILTLLTAQITSQPERSRLRQQIAPNYHQSNHVLFTLNLLSTACND